MFIGIFSSLYSLLMIMIWFMCTVYWTVKL